MEISVVIPTKDRLSYLQRVLPSFLMQEEVREIVIVIDGSVDGTREYLEELCKSNAIVRFVDNQVNRGISYSRNRGIDEATCEYIFMAEDDLELSEDFLHTLSTHMTEMNADVICGRNIFRYDTETQTESIVRTNRLKGSYVNMKTIEVETSMDIGVDHVEPIIAAPMLAKAALFREVKYDERFRVNFWREETDFQLSARERGYILACCPHAICFNFQSPTDRGGVHAAIGLRREKWVVINNWLFIKKHESFIAENFDIGNKRVHIVRFAVGRVLKFLVWYPGVHVLSKMKRLMLGRRDGATQGVSS
jgi:glycosyltransferase involved in cell wall biosynthesis